MFKPGEEKDAVFFKPNNATMIANAYNNYAFDTGKTKLSLPNTQWQGPIINTTKQATAKFAKLSAFKVSEFKNTLHGEFLPKGNGVKRGPKSEKLNIWSMTAIPGFWDIEPKTLLIPYGGKMDAKFVAVLDKKCDWSIGNTILKTGSNEISLAFEDDTQNSWDKKNATINYFEPQGITIRGKIRSSSDIKKAIVNIVGIKCLSVNQPNISTSDSSLEGSSKKSI